MHWVEGEAECGPEGEEGRVQCDDEQVNKSDHGGIEKHIDEMPQERIWSPEVVFGGIEEQLQRAIIVGALCCGRPRIVSKCPNVSGEGEAKIFRFENEGVLKNLRIVVGDETVAEGRGVEGEG